MGPPQAASGGEPPNGNNEQGRSDNANFECNICLDIAKDAVISLCGHLFCWACLHRWLETRPTRPVCPVCKAGIDKDKVIPIYGRDNPNQTDPREKLPPRPQAQRPEPETNYNPFNNFSFGGLGAGHGLGMLGNNNGLQFSFGIGAFPFSLFSWTMGNNINNNNNGQGQVPTARAQEEEFLSKAFLWIALFFLVWLIFA